MRYFFQGQEEEKGEKEGLEVPWKNEAGRVLYFGYGSNMSKEALSLKFASTSEEEKEKLPKLTPYSVRRGILLNWKLDFSVASRRPADPGFANVVPCPGASVHGCILEVDLPQLRLLDLWELCYQRILVCAEVYAEDRVGFEEKVVPVYVYVSNEVVLEEKGMKPRGFSLNHLSLTGENYLQTLVRGARQAGLREAYIRHLEEAPFAPHPNVQRDFPNLSTEMQREFRNLPFFSMEDVLHGERCLTVVAGIVLDMAVSAKGWQDQFGRRDLTSIMARRWVRFDEVEGLRTEILKNQNTDGHHEVNENGFDRADSASVACLSKTKKERLKVLEMELHDFVAGTVFSFYATAGQGCPYGNVVGKLKGKYEEFGWEEMIQH